MRIATATTLTNPNDNNDRFIKVKLHNSNKEYKAIFINKLDLDQREQRPNINVGTEVFVLIDEFHNIYVLGSLQQGIDLVGSKIYVIKNKDEVKVKTDTTLNMIGYDNNRINQTNLLSQKVLIENDTASLLQTLSDTIQAFIDNPIVIGNMGQPASIFDGLKSKLNDLKSKIDSFI